MHWGRRQVTGHQHSLHYHIKLQRHVQFFSKHSQLFFQKIFFFFTTLFIFLSKGNKSVCCSLEFFSWTELCFVIIPSLFRLFLLSPRFFFLSVPDKNYCCAKRHLLAVSAPTEADRRVLLSSANAEKRPLSCQGPYCVLK